MSRRKNLLSVRQNQEDMMIEKLDVDEFNRKMAKILRDAATDEGVSTRQLKKVQSEQRLRYIALRMAEALENNDMRAVEYWRSKTEEFCITRPRPSPEGGVGSEGYLAEAVATAMTMFRLKNKELTE